MKRKSPFIKNQKRKMRKGFLWIQYDVIDNPETSASDLLVYMVLARFANNETQVCYPSIKTLIKESGLTKPTIIKSIKQLEKLKLIEVDRKEGCSNYYQLNEPVKTFNQSKKIPQPVKNNTHEPVKNRPTNNTNNNNTNITTLTKKEKDLVNLLYKKIKENYPKLRVRPKTQRQFDLAEMNRLHRLDGWSYEDIERIIKWATNDDFWKQNIRSVRKLRKQFENLFVRAGKKQEVKKPFYQGNKMWYDKNKEKWFVIVDNNFNEFAGDEKEIEYKYEK